MCCSSHTVKYEYNSSLTSPGVTHIRVQGKDVDSKSDDDREIRD
jgi:hypothetical protein